MGNPSRITIGDIMNPTSARKHALGTITEVDGCKFVYAKDGGSGLAVAKMALGGASVANHQNMAVATNAAIGDWEVEVTLGATAATEDQYKDGIFHVNDATGEGQMYSIAGNKAADASASCIFSLRGQIRTALVAGTSEVSVAYHPYGAAQNSATEENFNVGIPRVAVTASYYFWAQRTGPAACLISGTPAVGSMLTHGAVAGSLIAMNGTLDIDNPVVGEKIGVAGVDTEYGLINLQLAC